MKNSNAVVTAVSEEAGNMRIVSGTAAGKRWYDVNQPSAATPNGFGQEETIGAIWAANK